MFCLTDFFAEKDFEDLSVEHVDVVTDLNVNVRWDRLSAVHSRAVDAVY